MGGKFRVLSIESFDLGRKVVKRMFGSYPDVFVCFFLLSKETTWVIDGGGEA